jgi:hypothetical protein
MTAILSSAGLMLLWAACAAAQDDKPAGDAKPSDRPAADRPAAADPAPTNPQSGQWQGFGPGPGRMDGLRPGLRLGPVGAVNRPGPNNRLGPPNRPGGPGEQAGPPDQLGPPGQFGPRRPDHPAGPPRWPHQDWDALQQNDPEMYRLLKEDNDLELRERELSFQYRQAPAAQRAAIGEEVKQLVAKHFDVRQQRRQLELKRLEAELKLLKEAIDARNTAREELTGRRVSQLLGKEEGLDF